MPSLSNIASLQPGDGDIEAGSSPTDQPHSYDNNATDELPPPTYAEATATPTGPPPSYNSLFGEIRDARSSTNSVFQFLRKLVILLISTVGCTIGVGIFMAIPITMIILGAKYKGDCPVEENIPIYLITGGSFGIFRFLLKICKKAQDNNQENEETKKHSCESIVDCFMFAWFIAGNVWIYSNYKPSFTVGDADYCHKTLYLFAFWLTNATYILIGATCLCLCCAGVLMQTQDSE